MQEEARGLLFVEFVPAFLVILYRILLVLHRSFDNVFECFSCFSLKLAKTRVKPEKRVNGERPLSESYLQMGEDRAGLVVERPVAILAQIALKVTIAAVLDRTIRTAARVNNTITLANLLQQVHCDRFRSKHIYLTVMNRHTAVDFTV